MSKSSKHLQPGMLLTCEHASAFIPKALQSRFDQRVWQEHQRVDIGARDLARYLSKTLSVPLVEAKVSRLVIDANRSLHHKKLSCLIQGSEAALRNVMIAKYHAPFRQIVEQSIRTNPQTLHFSIHSFTRILNNEVRKNDIGILYDPSSPRESIVADMLKNQLKSQGFIVRRNYPYLGKSDGHTTALRRRFQAQGYVGIEIEVMNERLQGQSLVKYCDALQKALEHIRPMKGIL